MPVSVLILLCVALVAMSVSSAASIYFVCKLVNKISKLAASPDIASYRTLMAVREPSVTFPAVEAEPSGATGNDGTLTDATLAKLAETI